MKTTLFVLFVALFLAGCGESSNPSSGVDMTDTAPEKDAIETAVDWSKLQELSGVTYLPNTDKPFSGNAKRAYENEQVEIFAQFKDGYVVRVKQWQENGNPKWDFGYSKGKVSLSNVPLKKFWSVHAYPAHGLCTNWHENGQKSYEGNFKDGKSEGLYTEWHENGQKSREINYKDGKVHGLDIRWHENGQKSRERNGKDGKYDGLETAWHENGQKKYEGNWKGGEKEGTVYQWYKNGQKKYEGKYKDGKLMSAEIWKPNGESCPVTNVMDGNGVIVSYNEDGTVELRLTSKDGKLVRD